MLHPPRPADRCLSLVVAHVLVLCVALIAIAACGSPTADTPQTGSPSPTDDNPADGLPTPTTAGPTPTTAGPIPTTAGPIPTNAARATSPVQAEAAAFVGMWAVDDDLLLELGDTGVYTLSRGYREPKTGTWSLQKDGSLELERESYDAIPHGNLLILGEADSPFILDILHRVDEDGNLLAYEPADAIEIPPIDASTILTITIEDHWTGLSPLAPIEAYFRLKPATGHFSGMAEFSVAGYTDAMTRSVPISVPLAVIDELLALLESTPLEAGEYKHLFNHTDDFPAVRIAVGGTAGHLEFASRSQGNRHIPWRAVVGRDQYVTYADTPVQALDLLDPYLARDVQQELVDLARARD